MLDQRRRRWANVVWMLCQCFVFTGYALFIHILYELHSILGNQQLPFHISRQNKTMSQKYEAGSLGQIWRHGATQETETKCCFNAGPASWTWANIETTLGECIVFAWDAVRLHVKQRMKNKNDLLWQEIKTRDKTATAAGLFLRSIQDVIISHEMGIVVPAIARLTSIVGLMMGQRRKRWTGIAPTLVLCVVLLIFVFTAYIFSMLDGFAL